MTRPRAGSGGARRVRCRCGRTVLRQLVGNRAALDVTADPDTMTPAEARALRTPYRLDWCVRTTRDGIDLRWADCHRWSKECTRPHVVDHQCPGPSPSSPGRRSTRTTPVPEGQLTLG